DYLPDDIIAFRDLLSKGLKNELQLHPSITEDIGYLKNIMEKHNQQEFPDDKWTKSSNLVYENDEYYSLWVGTQYLLWGHNDLKTWIYNDKTGNIILEVTPLYPDLFTEDKSTIKISYDVWIKSYKPFLIRI